MKILGISAYYHDSSAALLVDGAVVAAAQEERFTRVKHDNGFPVNACRFCLEHNGLKLRDIDTVVFYEKPFLKFERILVSQIVSFPKSLPMFLRTIPIWLKDKLNMRRNIRNKLNEAFGCQPRDIKFVEHHLSHAALAYCSSGFEDADIIILDAVGEWATTSIMKANGSEITVVSEQRFPDSIGLLYSSFTQFLGFKVNSDEYKVMGLASYGDTGSEETKSYINKIKTQLLHYEEEGDMTLNLSYFKFHYGDRMIQARKWERLFGIPSRSSDVNLNQSYMNLAFAIQTVTEEILCSIVESMKVASKSDNLCLCGGVALNCAANGSLLSKGTYRNIYVPFAPGDCGCSIGAALAVAMLAEQKPSESVSPYLGPDYSDESIEKTLIQSNLPYITSLSIEDLCNKTARLIADGCIIGWFQGRMEVGPRALGNRSILADPRRKEIKDKVNARIKFRESFRPFAPSVMEEYAQTLFNSCQHSPYMMFTFPVKNNTIPAVTHTDGTARVQTVSKRDNPRYYNLLYSFYNLTGCPAILNTSFNVMGEPMVCTPKDAIDTFKKSGLDYLIINNFIVSKV